MDKDAIDVDGCEKDVVDQPQPQQFALASTILILNSIALNLTKKDVIRVDATMKLMMMMMLLLTLVTATPLMQFSQLVTLLERKKF